MLIQTIKYLLLFFFFTSNLFAQNIFDHRNPHYSSEQINHINFFNNIGFAVGNHGLILKTADNGLNWFEQYINTSANIKKVFLLDLSNSYVFDDSSRIYKTTNSGNNWVFTSSIFGKINDLLFVNQSKGYVITDAAVYITTNSGVNWVSLLTDYSSLKYLSINFKDSQTGYLSALNTQTNYAIVLKTINGGLNWFEYNTAIDGYEISNIYFINSATGYCAGSRFNNLFVIKTTNGGVNWFESHTLYNSFLPNNLYFYDINTGYISSNSKLIKTTNGGNNWFSVINCNGVLSSYFKNDSSFFLTDTYSRILLTNNNGENFDTLIGKNNYILNRVQIAGENNVWCNGFNTTNFKSTNSGLNWSFDDNSNSLKIKYCTFSDASTGFSVAGRGTIMKTTNFGNNWNTVFNSPNEINTISVSGNQYVWAFGNNEIYKSIDGGINWVTLSNNNNIYKGKFFDGQNGICFNNVYLYKTSNGGINFTQIIDDYVSDFSFLNISTGFVVVNIDSISVIKQTINGGNNWIIKSTIDDNINRIRFINQFTGYLMNHDRVYRSTNGGINWKFVYLPTKLRAFDFDFADEYTGFLCGDNSMILKIINGGAIYIQEPLQTLSDFHILQNYPNPFNSETNIKFIITKPGFTILKIYDIQGREVSVLLNKYLNPQTYILKINSATLSSGIYFYTINQNGLSITKKFVLLK